MTLACFARYTRCVPALLAVVCSSAREPVKKSGSVLKFCRELLRMCQDVQVMDDGAAAQIEEILARPPKAGVSALPLTNMGQGMFHCYPLTQPSTALWRLLTLAPFGEQGFVRMNAHTAAFGAGGALHPQWTLSAYLFGEVDDPTGLKGHFLLSRTANRVTLPIKNTCLLVKMLALVDRPGFTIDFEFITPLPHEMTTQIAPVDVELLYTHALRLQVGADVSCHARFRHIRRCDSYRTDEIGIQITQHMAFVSIHAHAPAFAPVPHLGVFNADASIFGDSFDKAHLPFLIDLHILRLDMLGNLQRWLSQFSFFLRERLHPGFHGLQDESERFVSLLALIPVTIECCFHAGPTHHCCTGFLPGVERSTGGWPRTQKRAPPSMSFHQGRCVWPPPTFCPARSFKGRTQTHQSDARKKGQTCRG